MGIDKVIDFGFDLDIYKGPFGITFDCSAKNFRILSSIPVPASLVYQGPTTNNGEMHSTGIEIDLRHENRIGEVLWTEWKFFNC
jgi:hypothetical protein